MYPVCIPEDLLCLEIPFNEVAKLISYSFSYSSPYSMTYSYLEEILRSLMRHMFLG